MYDRAERTTRIEHWARQLTETESGPRLIAVSRRRMPHCFRLTRWREWRRGLRRSQS